MEIDHLIPEALGGQTVEDNLWLACTICNKHKASRINAADPFTDETVLLFDPRRQSWNDHFRWTTNGTQVVGITATGRATVLALNLNRPPLIKSRELWVGAGWHPPLD